MNDAPVTKRDLDEAMGGLREEFRGEMSAMKTELRGEMSAMKTELRDEMSTMKTELRGEMTELRGEMSAMKTEMSAMKTEMSEMKTEMKTEMSAMKTELLLEIGQAASRVANVMMEHIQTLISVVDEKYQDLPPLHAKLRVDFDDHMADRRLHTRLPAAPSKRVRRPRSR